MSSKADASVFAPDERFPLLREICGILLGLLALLILLALISFHQQHNWIGQRGAAAAELMVLVFGNYVAYVFPALLGISAVLVLWRTPTGMGRGWLRGLGGVLILTATCALLTLPSFTAAGFDKPRALEMGGIIGNFLVHPSGLNLAAQLGIVGAAVVFGGLSLIGLVMFTETLLRDLAAIGWRGMARAAQALGAAKLARLFNFIAWLSPVRLVARVSARINEIFWLGIARVRSFTPIAWARDFFAGINFSTRERERGHVLGRTAPPAPLVIPPKIGVPASAERTMRGSLTIMTPEEAARPSKAVNAPIFEMEPDEDEGVAMERPLPDMPKPRVTRTVTAQPEMELFPSAYELPSLVLLSDPPTTRYVMTEDEKLALAQRIEQTLATFKIEVQVIEVIQGPVITRFALKVAAGVRVNRILALESELAMAMKAHHVRILAPIPGQAAVGIEVPNKRANTVMLKELLATDEFQTHKSALSFALGKNISGEPVVCDLAQMPHLLIAGATGSGKSVCLNTIIASFLYRNPPDKIKFVMIDPKRVELSIYQAIPHLWTPVVTECKKAAAALAWCVEQMEERYKLLAELGVRNIDGYNALAASDKPNKKLMGRDQLKYLPHVVIIIDELADLMMVARNEVEEYIIRLAQMARAVGMHLILATQRPSVNVITGIIKANFPSRIAFQVSSKVDSRTILDMNGAEALMGRGDMLYSPGGVKPFRLQGAFVSDAEVERLADYIREQERARYVKEDFEVKPTPAERAKAHRGLDGEDGEAEEWEEADGGELDELATRGRAADAPLKPFDLDAMNDEELYDMALKLVLQSRKGSVSYIQRRMKIGYARAGRLMDMMEERGIVGPYQGSKPRDILVNPAEYLAQKN